MKRLVKLVLLLMVVGNLQAQTKLTLEECIRIGLENNLAIKNTQYQMDLEESRLLQNRARMLPTLGFGIGQSMNFGRSIDVNTNEFIEELFFSNGMGLDLRAPIFNGFNLKNQAKQISLNIKASMKDIESSRNLMRRNITTFYLQALANEELAKIADEQRNTTRQQMDLAQKRVAAGVANEIVVYELKAQLATESFNAVNARNNADMAKVSLFQQMNQPVDLSATLDANMTGVLEKANEQLRSSDLFSTAQAALPEVQAANLRIQGSDKAIEAARGNYLPSVSLNASYNAFFSSTRSEDYFKQINATRNGSTGLSLSIPLFQGGSVRQQVNQAEINKQIAQNRLAETQNQLRRDIEEAVQNYNATLQQWNTAEEQVEAQSEAQRMQEKRFQAGTATTAEYILSRNNLLQAQGNLVSAKYRHLVWKMVVGFYERGAW
jgi:outer membrane protein